MTVRSTSIDKEEVARRAYEIWESRGCPPGDGIDDWNSALAELLAAEPATDQTHVCGIDGERVNPPSTPRNEAEQRGIRVWFTRMSRNLLHGRR